jgi:hypothetical protein
VESKTCLVSLLLRHLSTFLRLLGGFFCSHANGFFGRLSNGFTFVNGRGESLSNFDINLYNESKYIYLAYCSVLTSEATSLTFSVADLSATGEEWSVRLETASGRVVRIAMVRYMFSKKFDALRSDSNA